MRGACTSFPLHRWGLALALREPMFAFHSHSTHQIKDLWWNRHRCFQVLLCCVLNVGIALVMLLSDWQYQVHRPALLAIWKASPVSGSLTSKDEHKVMGCMFICGIHMVGKFWPKRFCQKQLCLDLLRVQTPEESNAKGKAWFITWNAIIPSC